MSTLITSDHCFVNKDLFILLILLCQLTMGFAIGKKFIFNIIEKEKARVKTIVNGANKTITFEDMLHTPELCSNLISVSKPTQNSKQYHCHDC